MNKSVENSKELNKLKEILMRYFSIGDSDYYWCQRVKEAFIIGTMSIEDFVELDETMVDDLISYIANAWNKKGEIYND